MATQEYQSSSGAIIFRHTPEELAVKKMKKDLDELNKKYEDLLKKFEELATKLDDSN